MDTFGKVFYESRFSSTWKRIGPSDDPPELFLPTQDLTCLLRDHDPEKPPSEILRDSEVYIRSDTIMSKVCQGLRSNSDEPGSFRKVSSFQFCVSLGDSKQADGPSAPVTEYWLTVHYRPTEKSITIFGRESEEKQHFLSDMDVNMQRLSDALRTINLLWDYEPLVFSAADITWITRFNSTGFNSTVHLPSGLANVLYLYSTIYPDKFEPLSSCLGSPQLLSYLHQLLVGVSQNPGKRKLDVNPGSRKRSKIQDEK